MRNLGFPVIENSKTFLKSKSQYVQLNDHTKE